MGNPAAVHSTQLSLHVQHTLIRGCTVYSLPSFRIPTTTPGQACSLHMQGNGKSRKCKGNLSRAPTPATHGSLAAAALSTRVARMPTSRTKSVGSKGPTSAAPHRSQVDGPGRDAATPAHLRHSRRLQVHADRTGARFWQLYSAASQGHSNGAGSWVGPLGAWRLWSGPLGGEQFPPARTAAPLLPPPVPPSPCS